MFFLDVWQDFFQIQSKFANDVEEMGMGNIEIMAFGKKTWKAIGFSFLPFHLLFLFYSTFFCSPCVLICMYWLALYTREMQYQTWYLD